MKRKRNGLDLSLVRSRDAEKSKHKKEGFLRNRREIISAIFLSFALGAGSGLIMTNVKVPMYGPESPKIPLIQKIKYDVSDWWNDVHKTDENKSEEKIEVPEEYEEYKDKFKIHIEIPTDSDCGPDNTTGCLIS